MAYLPQTHRADKTSRAEKTNRFAIREQLSDANNLAVIALITGLISLLPVPFIPFIAPLTAVVTGILALKRKPRIQVKYRVFAILGLFFVFLWAAILITLASIGALLTALVGRTLAG